MSESIAVLLNKERSLMQSDVRAEAVRYRVTSSSARKEGRSARAISEEGRVRMYE